MDIYPVVAFISGFISGLIFYTPNTSHRLLTLYYAWPMMSEENFYETYDAVLYKENINLFITQLGLKNAQSLRKMHAKSRDGAYAAFRGPIDVLHKLYLRRLVPISLVIGLVFIWYYPYYLLGMVLIAAASITYTIHFKHDLVGIQQRALLLTAIKQSKSL